MSVALEILGPITAASLLGWVAGAVTSTLLFRSRLDVYQATFGAFVARYEDERKDDAEKRADARRELERELAHLREAHTQTCRGLATDVERLRGEMAGAVVEFRGLATTLASSRGEADRDRRERAMLELLVDVAEKTGTRSRLLDMARVIDRPREDKAG